jgi:hypothetical protein
VLQYNKRDIRNIVPVDKLNEVLNAKGRPFFEAAALHGIGVFETLKAISRLSLGSVRSKVATENQAKKAAPTPPPVAPPAAPPKAAAAPAAAPPRPPAAPARPAPVPPPPPAPAPAPPPKTTPVPRAAPVVPVAASGGAAAAAAEDLRVEFAEEDPEKHVVRPVSTKGNVDIQDALSKLRSSVVATTTRPSIPLKPAAEPPGAAGSDLNRRLQDVIGSVGDETKQDIRKKLTLEVPAEWLRVASAVRLHVTFERNGSEEGLSEPITLKFTPGKKLAQLAVRLDLELKGK